MTKDSDLKKRSGAELRAQAAARIRPPVSSRQQRLDAYREVIVRRQRDFVETGTALGLIAKENLFKEAGFVSFEAMVIGEFDMSTSTAYRLVDAARVVTILSQVGTIETKIRNQAQALALAPLGRDREAMVLVITAAEARGRVTADLLANVRVELYPHTRVIEGEVVGERPELVEAVRAGIESVEANQKKTAAEVVDRPADGGETDIAEPPADGPGASTVGEADRPGPSVNPTNVTDEERGPVVPVAPPAPSEVPGVAPSDGAEAGHESRDDSVPADEQPRGPAGVPGPAAAPQTTPESSPGSGEAVQGEAEGPRPVPEPSDPAALLGWFAADMWSQVDYDAAGPLLSDDDVTWLGQSLEFIAELFDRLIKARNAQLP